MSVTYARAKPLLEAELGDEIVGLDVDGGNCFGFNSVAADIWRLLQEPQRIDLLQAQLMDIYDVEADLCAEQIGQCLAEFERQGLVRSSRTS